MADSRGSTEALSAIDGWEPDRAAAGVTGADGLCATHGPSSATFALASVTKLLTSAGVLIAVQDGLVHLDEPAGPDGATVRHLLAHAAGLPFEEGAPGGAVEARRIYSNVGFEVLGDLLERRTGVSAAEWITDEVLAPLGMADTRMEGSPAHGARGSVEDLLRLGRELLEPQLLDPALLEEARNVQFPGLGGVLPGFGRQEPNAWGLGFEIRDDKHPHWTGGDNSPETFGHFGQSGSFLWVDPTAGLACAFLGDRDFGDWAGTRWPELSDAVLNAYASR